MDLGRFRSLGCAEPQKRVKPLPGSGLGAPQLLESRRQKEPQDAVATPNLCLRSYAASALSRRTTWLSRSCAALAFAVSALGDAPQTGAASLLPNESLAGHTLSAVIYLPAPPDSHRGDLARLMVQAYLSPDGGALVRLWNTEADRYSVPATSRWSLSGSRLCIGLPSGETCVDVHVWGPRIDGIATDPYRMLVGDLRPGNAILSGR
jgi:hypothetical protein